MLQLYEINAQVCYSCIFITFMFVLRKDQNHSEIMLDTNNKCFFIYLYTLTFTLKGFKGRCYCTEASNI